MHPAAATSPLSPPIPSSLACASSVLYREIVEKTIRAKSCKWGVYISQRKQTGDTWILVWTHNHHSHHPNPNTFSHSQYTAKKPRYIKALARASVHSGVASYTTSSKMLRKEGLRVY